MGLDSDDSGSMKDGSDDDKSKHDEDGAAAPQPVQGNNAAANLV